MRPPVAIYLVKVVRMTLPLISDNLQHPNVPYFCLLSVLSFEMTLFECVLGGCSYCPLHGQAAISAFDP